ncbi:MAG: GGDEF domain-containing protein, partial [Oscillospiraceae bacterium]|nr:GGDEF domain-containing protein [Oscillospiraceae bacterium]
MSKFENAAANGGIIVFTMMYKPDFPMDFLFDKNPFCMGKTALFGDIVHPDDYQPFCEILGDVVSHRSNELKTHARLMCGDFYHWFYITASPEFNDNGLLAEINGVMYDVTMYLDCEGDDPVMRGFLKKTKTAFDSAEHTPRLLNVLGENYLKQIQQPFTFINGLYSEIVDTDGRRIAAAVGQDESENLNKMSYQRKKSIRIKHQNVASWVIAGESPDDINRCAPLLDTMVQTVSELANSYIVISEEMENSQKANKLLGQNFEDQILINNIYSMILQSKNTSSSFGSVIPLIKEYFALDDLLFCSDAQQPARTYRWDESGSIVPMVSGDFSNERIDKDLENDAVVCVSENELNITEGKGRSCALSRIYENGSSRGVIVFISGETERVWTNRDRKLIRTITQIMSTVIYRSFMENELAVSQEHLLRLAYYNTTTGIPNRSAFERDFRDDVANGGSGAIVSVEIANLKQLSEIYS